MTETCEQEPDALQLIVHVETTPATTEDHEVLPPLLDQERQQGRAPEEMYVDMGYTGGPVLVQQASLLATQPRRSARAGRSVSRLAQSLNVNGGSTILVGGS